MGSSGIISVNDARLAIDKDGSLTAVIGSNTIYNRSHASFARKKEVNVRVVASDGGDLLIRNMPLFDEHDLKEMQNQSGEFKYVHIGCITVSIEPLIHHKFLAQYGKSIKGICVVFDSTFEVFEESIISAHQFDLSAGRADFICYPNHCLSASDCNLNERLSVLLCMDNIRTKKGNELMTICIGHITTGTNTLNPSGGAPPSLKTVGVTGTIEVEMNQIGDDIVHRLNMARQSGTLDVVPTGGDQFIRPKHKGLKHYFLKPPKVVVRRNYDTQLAMVNRGISKSEEPVLEEPRMSLSAPSSPVHNNDFNRAGKYYPGESSNSRPDRYYLDGSIIRQAIRTKKENLRAASARYDEKKINLEMNK
uniref:P3 n=1 Tax=Lotus corniculatus virus 1 TaxID=2793731 RepID=A0A8D9UJ26_9RHAB|nr:TPA_asm: P3 [Lotus corniculatus virus 1]